MTPKEIATLLAEDTENICRMLLPEGKRVQAEWEAGSTEGGKGKSCKVHLTGAKAGVWCDFATGDAGDLLDLWAKSRGVTLSEAIKQAKAHLGLRDTKLESRRSWKKPTKPVCRAPSARVLDYLVSRGLAPETISAYKLAASPDETEIIFPFLRDGELLNVKHLKVERPDGKKIMRIERDCELCLFGWQAIPDSARSVSICEGELDSASLFQYGFPALSVPNGATGHTWIETEFENLERFDEIFLCFDRDQPGEKAAHEIAKRLGIERCKIVKLPYKDANECLTKKVPQDAMQEIFQMAATLDPCELRRSYEYTEKVKDSFRNQGSLEPGFNLPFQKLNERVRVRFGEVLLLAGYNGSGKSQLAGQITVSAMDQGIKSCVASMEFKPPKWLRRMYVQVAATRNPSEPYQDAIATWLEDRLWVFDVTGSTKVEKIIEVFRYGVKRYNIRFFVIDNLSKCGIAETDYDAQKAAIDSVTDFARDYDVAVLLLHHMRKSEDEIKAGGKMDVKGSGALSDMVDTVLTLWRNKKREREIDKCKIDGTEVPIDVTESVGAVLACEKQRNGDEEPRLGMWFDNDTYQFLERRNDRPKRYLDFRAAPTALIGGGQA